jgi:uncharacterized RDD family membrane protein YckC
VSHPAQPAGATGASYPGQRLGLPREGRGAVAGWGRRVAALAVDWLACKLVLTVFLGGAAWTGTGISQLAPMGLFLLEATLLTLLAGGSFGQLALRVVVVRVDNKPLTLLGALLRTFLILLVIPPLVFNSDQRGLHDLAARTVTLRR